MISSDTEHIIVERKLESLPYQYCDGATEIGLGEEEEDPLGTRALPWAMAVGKGQSRKATEAIHKPTIFDLL